MTPRELLQIFQNAIVTKKSVKEIENYAKN